MCAALQCAASAAATPHKEPRCEAARPPLAPCRFGTPMQLVLAVVSIVVLVAGEDNWHFVWIVTGICGTVLLSLPQVVEWLQAFKARSAQKHLA